MDKMNALKTTGLAEGISLSDIAEATGFSRETMHSNLRAVFTRTGARTAK